MHRVGSTLEIIAIVWCTDAGHDVFAHNVRQIDNEDETLLHKTEIEYVSMQHKEDENVAMSLLTALKHQAWPKDELINAAAEHYSEQRVSRVLRALVRGEFISETTGTQSWPKDELVSAATSDLSQQRVCRILRLLVQGEHLLKNTV